MGRIRKFALMVGVLPLLLSLRCPISFADTPPVLILSEVKVRNDTAGFDEFIEIYNPGSTTVSLNDYYIGYINTPAPAADQQFTEAVLGDGLLESGHSFVLAKNDADPNLAHAKKSPFSSLSDSGGTIHISDASHNTIDQLAWTNLQSLAIAPVQYLANTNNTKPQSFQRLQDTTGQYIFTNSWQLGTPTPLSSDLLPLPPPPEPEPEPLPDSTTTIQPTNDPAPTPDVTTQTPDVSQTDQAPAGDNETTDPTPANFAPPLISELLPNPAPPASDSNDEFVELYNPNDTAINLHGYKLQTGNSFSYNYTFPDTELTTHEYHAFMVSETGDILSNSGGQARLLDPNGVIVAQTNIYDQADDGMAWALINGAWQWTTSPTPNAPNMLALPIIKTTTPKTTTKKTTTPKTSTTKTTAKSSTAKTTKAAPKTTSPIQRDVYSDPATVDITPIHPAILAGVGVITLVYAGYEYRHDAFNFLSRFRRQRDLRRAARPVSQGR